MFYLKPAMYQPFVRDPEKLFYAQSLDKLYKEVQCGYPPVFEFTFCSYAASYDRIRLLHYSNS